MGKGCGRAHLGTVIPNIWSSRVISVVGGEIYKDRTLGYVTNMLRDLGLQSLQNRRKQQRLIVQELCESGGGRPGLSVLTSLLVSVDVKLY